MWNFPEYNIICTPCYYVHSSICPSLVHLSFSLWVHILVILSICLFNLLSVYQSEWLSCNPLILSSMYLLVHISTCLYIIQRDWLWIPPFIHLFNWPSACPSDNFCSSFHPSMCLSINISANLTGQLSDNTSIFPLILSHWLTTTKIPT